MYYYTHICTCLYILVLTIHFISIHIYSTKQRVAKGAKRLHIRNVVHNIISQDNLVTSRGGVDSEPTIYQRTPMLTLHWQVNIVLNPRARADRLDSQVYSTNTITLGLNQSVVSLQDTALIMRVLSLVPSFPTQT
jgi:hypothetical protein